MMLRLWPCSLVITLLTAVAAPVVGKPYVPDSDATVLERLPEKGDPALTQLKRLRAVAASDPRNLELALAVARRAVDAARTLGDPRFLGQAQAALGRWWQGDDVPAPALLMRATLKQSQHDFEGSLKDLDTLLRMQPGSPQGLLTRATVLTVRGRYEEARRDCARLGASVPDIVSAGCDAAPASLSGDAAAAYRRLLAALERSAGNPDLVEWGLTLAAEIATREGDAAAAERHFRAALAIDPRDPYLKGAYADFLLDHDRPQEVRSLLTGDVKNDSLLLRLTLAEQRLPDARADYLAHREALAERFAAAQRRGDSLHRREEARFRLEVENDPERALRLARENWAVQREPADLHILLKAATAMRDEATIEDVRKWVRTTHLADAKVTALLQAAR